MNDSLHNKNETSWFFDAGLILKAANGVFELVVAFLVLVVPPDVILKMTVFITGGELSQDPDDPVMNAILQAAKAFTVRTHYLLALYLAAHGAAKVVLVWGILKEKKFAFPLFIAALGIFGSYETYRGLVRHEILLQILAAFDIILLLLTAREYRRRYALPSLSDR